MLDDGEDEPGRGRDRISSVEDTDGVDAATFDDLSESMYPFPEMPAYVKTVGVAAGAAVAGMALGYWLGGWRARRKRSVFSFADVDVADFAKLAPDLAHLMKNPLVRAYLAKAAMKQVRRWLDS